MKMNEDVYVPFNYFTLQDKQDCYKGVLQVQDKDAHDLKGEFTAQQLESINSTSAIVDGIEKMLNRYGKNLSEDSFMLDDYDDDGYYLNYDESEHKITLVCFPGVFIKKSDLELLKDAYLSKWRENSDFVEYDFMKSGMDSLPKLVFENKVYLRITVAPETLFCDHHRDLLIDGVDVRQEYISGIVDIEKFCDLLKEKGIDIEFTTINIHDLRNDLVKARKLYVEGKISFDDYMAESEFYRDYVFPKLNHVNFNQFLDNLVKTRMQSSLTISIPFGKYLRETKEFHK